MESESSDEITGELGSDNENENERSAPSHPPRTEITEKVDTLVSTLDVRLLASLLALCTLTPTFSQHTATCEH